MSPWTCSAPFYCWRHCWSSPLLQCLSSNCTLAEAQAHRVHLQVWHLSAPSGSPGASLGLLPQQWATFSQTATTTSRDGAETSSPCCWIQAHRHPPREGSHVESLFHCPKPSCSPTVAPLQCQVSTSNENLRAHLLPRNARQSPGSYSPKVPIL